MWRFNLVQDPDLDYKNYNNINNMRARETLLEFKTSNYMVDPFRELHPKLRRYTWHRRNPIQQARLDFFLLSESLLPSR